MLLMKEIYSGPGLFGKIGKITFLDYKKQCEERTAETLMEEKAFCDKVKR